MLFVPQDNKNAIYSTDVEAGNNSIGIRNIEIPNGLSEMLTISGEYIPLDQQVRRDARITALTSDGTGVITSVHTDPVTGKYDLMLPPGQTYMLVVEGGGYVPHAESFELPDGMTNPVLKQIVRLNKNQTSEEMTLENFFSSGKVATEPTARAHHLYESNPDRSKMLGITINNEIVYVPSPAEKSSEAIVETSDSSKSTIVVIRRDENLPLSISNGSFNDSVVDYAKADEQNSTAVNENFHSDEKPATAESDNLIQDTSNKSETESFTDTTNPDEKLMNDIEPLNQEDTVQASSFSKDISNEELAKIAFEDAKNLQMEADSLKKEVASMKKTSSNLDEYAEKLKADGSENDTILNSQISTLHSQADQFRKRGADLEIEANAKDIEAVEALANANEIFKSSGTKKTSTAKSNTTKTNNLKAENKKTVSPIFIYDDTVPSVDELATNKSDSAVLNTDGKIMNETAENVHSNTAVSQENDNTSLNNAASLESLNSNTEIDHSTASDQISSTDVKNSDLGAQNDSILNSDLKISSIETANAEIPEDVNSSADKKVESNKVSIDSSFNEKSALKLPTFEGNQDEKSSNLARANSEEASNVVDSVSALTPGITLIDSANSVNTANTQQQNNSNPEKNIPDSSSSKLALISENKIQEPGENPKGVTKTFEAKDYPGYSGVTVNEEAKVAYRQSQIKLEESNVLSNHSLRIQDEISHLKSSPKRDSLILVSNEMTKSSIDIWTEALKMMETARQIEPDIDYKMSVIDFMAQHGSTENLATSGNSVAIKQKEESKVSEKPETKTGNTEATIAQNQQELLDPQVNAKEDTSTDLLDTTHPDYPLYAKLQSDITNKQVETIDVFAEAINLSRMSSDETEQANKLLDEAQTESDTIRIAGLINSSNDLKKLAQQHDTEAKSKFDIAKNHTIDVKELVAQMKVVKQRITLKPGENLASTKRSTLTADASGTKLSDGGGLTVLEKPQNKKLDAQAFAMAERVNSGLNASDEEIAAVSISSEQRNNFLNTCFNHTEGSYYSSSNPVPMNPELPEGLVFKVQIGAFRAPLSPETFKGLQPLSGETTRPGWIRYCVGMFKTFEPANTVKNEIKRNGYKDAFVVAYYNGKRIELNDAYTIIRNKENVMAYRSESAKEMAILQNMNIRPVAVTKDQDVLAFYAKQPLPETLRDNDAETIKAMNEVDNGEEVSTLKYTVQLGVFNTPSAPIVLNTMNPLPASKVKEGKYRYTTMSFDDKKSADSVKDVAVKSGIADAFVVGVKYGKIVAVNNTTVKSNLSNKQKWNDAVKDDLPTADPVFKVQIGAFKNDIPYNIVEAYLSISDKGITRKTDERGLHIFYAGSFNDLTSATALRREINSKGIKDAFVVVLQNGKRVAIPE
jgi:hypothetical protein